MGQYSKIVKPFADLSYTGQVKRLKQLARSALDKYDLGQVRLISLGHGENTTFKVEAQSNKSSQNSHDNRWYALRIYRHNKHTPAAIQTELLWLVSLRQDTNLIVPKPVPTQEGALMAIAQAPGVPEPRCCALFHWLPGRTLDLGFSTKAMEQIGRFLAQLHQYSQQFVPPAGFVRPRLDENELLRVPISLPTESEEIIPPAEQAVLEAIANQIREQMHCLEQQPESFGLIHGDLHHHNCKFHRGEVQVFDFDDCGWGYYLYDLAITLYYLRDRQEFSPLQQALFRGYQQVRSLPTQHETCLKALMAARRIHLLRDLLLRQDNPKLRALTPKFVASSVEELEKLLNR